MADAAERLGIIGTGNMGGRIARRIAEGGTSVVTYDVDPAAAKAAGNAVGSIKELADEVDIVFMSLPDSSVIEAVCLRDGGLVSSARRGQVVVDLSTAYPASSIRLHEAFLEIGVDFLDAGISGGAAAAERGTLAIMAGGSAEALERVRFALELFSANVYYMGRPGSGHTTKILNNFLNGVSLAATAEAMVAAKLAGLDLDAVLDVFNHSSGVNYATVNRFPRIVHGDYLEGGLTGKLMLKDVELYLDLARSLTFPSVMGPPTATTFQLSNALGYGDVISNRVADAFGDLAGGIRLSGNDKES